MGSIRRTVGFLVLAIACGGADVRDLHDIDGITGAAFEVVETGAIITE